ncbi:MAG: hypothetical protein MUO78_05145, partial [candidate division Zixibacteria bacterium]|nr:hypothetical protein [candidate division Zixibacteria bacterium]
DDLFYLSFVIPESLAGMIINDLVCFLGYFYGISLENHDIQEEQNADGLLRSLWGLAMTDIVTLFFISFHFSLD